MERTISYINAYIQVERIISLVVLLSREEPLANHRIMMERGADLTLTLTLPLPYPYPYPLTLTLTLPRSPTRSTTSMTSSVARCGRRL